MATIEGLSTASDFACAPISKTTSSPCRKRTVVAYEGATVDAVVRRRCRIHRHAGRRCGADLVRATATNLSPTCCGHVDPAALEDVSGGVDVSLNLQTPSLDLVQATGDHPHAPRPASGRSSRHATHAHGIVARDGFARIESWNWAGEGTTVAIAGQVRLADRQAAILVNGDIDLRVLSPVCPKRRHDDRRPADTETVGDRSARESQSRWRPHP